jgi:hypothetical protein
VEFCRFRNHVILLSITFMLGSGGCIESRCYQNADCPQGKVCWQATGVCGKPECWTGSDCPSGFLCDDFLCRAGCLDDAECGDGFRCINAQCVLFQEKCNCPEAPDFCQVDMNPNSPSSGQQVCVSDYKQGGLALFFGSVRCSHCWSNFQAAMKLAGELNADGHPVELAFIHLGTVETDADAVNEKMPWAIDPVLADTEQLAIWDRYLADWYHFIIVDRQGCVHEHFGPVVPENFDLTGPGSIRDSWTTSLTTECNESEPFVEGVDDPPGDIVEQELEVIPELDLAPEIPDLLEDLPVEDIPVEDMVTTTDGPDDLVPELPEDLTSDLNDTSQPAEICQIVTGNTPPEIGDYVPYFSCVDVNSTSALYGESVSPWALQGKIWIAYFGSCT